MSCVEFTVPSYSIMIDKMCSLCADISAIVIVFKIMCKNITDASPKEVGSPSDTTSMPALRR